MTLSRFGGLQVRLVGADELVEFALKRIFHVGVPGRCFGGLGPKITNGVRSSMRLNGLDRLPERFSWLQCDHGNGQSQNNAVIRRYPSFALIADKILPGGDVYALELCGIEPKRRTYAAAAHALLDAIKAARPTANV